MTLWPRRCIALGKAPITSPRPPVLLQGAHSAPTKTMFMTLSPANGLPGTAGVAAAGLFGEGGAEEFACAVACSADFPVLLLMPGPVGEELGNSSELGTDLGAVAALFCCGGACCGVEALDAPSGPRIALSLLPGALGVLAGALTLLGCSAFAPDDARLNFSSVLRYS